MKFNIEMSLDELARRFVDEKVEPYLAGDDGEWLSALPNMRELVPMVTTWAAGLIKRERESFARLLGVWAEEYLKSNKSANATDFDYTMECAGRGVVEVGADAVTKEFRGRGELLLRSRRDPRNPTGDDIYPEYEWSPTGFLIIRTDDNKEQWPLLAGPWHKEKDLPADDDRDDACALWCRYLIRDGKPVPIEHEPGMLHVVASVKQIREGSIFYEAHIKGRSNPAYHADPRSVTEAMLRVDCELLKAGYKLDGDAPTADGEVVALDGRKSATVDLEPTKEKLREVLRVDPCCCNKINEWVRKAGVNRKNGLDAAKQLIDAGEIVNIDNKGFRLASAPSEGGAQ